MMREARGNSRTEKRTWLTLVLEGIAQNVAHFLLHAAPMTGGPAPQTSLYIILEMTNNKLCHRQTLPDIMISIRT
jgi:hypothetical protein